MWKQLGWYVIVFDTNNLGYVMDRQYQVVLQFNAQDTDFRKKVQRDCLPHETWEDWGIPNSPPQFKDVATTAYWMY
jgi:hypothetical protein